MESNFRKNLTDELGRRAQLSMLGKGLIGLAGGIIILFLAWLRTCNKDNNVELESPKVKWFNYNVINLATTLDSNKRVSHFTKLGISLDDADSIAEFIAARNVGGSIVHELNRNEIDSLSSTFSLPLLNAADKSETPFYVQSLKHADYIVITKDSLIQNIINIPE